jgi:hypothetical protein
MCQLCQNKRSGETSVLQEIFHELGMESPEPQTGSTKTGGAQTPDYRLPWRERRARKMRRGNSPNSILNEVLQNLG